MDLLNFLIMKCLTLKVGQIDLTNLKMLNVMIGMYKMELKSPSTATAERNESHIIDESAKMDESTAKSTVESMKQCHVEA
jgi:hypothetical protein